MKKARAPERTPEGEFDPIVRQHIEEIQRMRGEIDWRVRAAYTSSLAFISIISFVVSTLFDENNTFREQAENDDPVFLYALMGITAFLAAFLGVQNANHLIEKRIELYSLHLIKRVKQLTGQPFAMWLPFLYGHPIFRRRQANSWAKVLNASIGFFQYFMPNMIMLGLCAGLWFKYYGLGPDTLPWWTPIGMVFVSFFVLLAAGTTIYFFSFMKRLDSQMTRFYKHDVAPYLPAMD